MRIYGKNYEPGEIENRSAGPPADGAKGNMRRGRTTCSTWLGYCHGLCMLRPWGARTNRANDASQVNTKLDILASCNVDKKDIQIE